MNTITTDMDWLSILFVIASVAIGFIKMGKKKEFSSPVPSSFPEENQDEPEAMIEEIGEEKTAVQEMPEDYYQSPLPSRTRENIPDPPTEEEKSKESAPLFDPKQAFIANEILNRPNF